jgi:hypothetical protein
MGEAPGKHLLGVPPPSLLRLVGADPIPVLGEVAGVEGGEEPGESEARVRFVPARERCCGRPSGGCAPCPLQF